MSSPSEMPGGDSAAQNVDLDAEMQDAGTQDSTARQNENADLDMTTQADTQQAPTGSAPSNLSHHNRKDVTLREFLSKMDDYAPIVLLPPPACICSDGLTPSLLDTRRSHSTLPNAQRSPPSLPLRPHGRKHKHHPLTTRPPISTRDPEIRCRHCRRRIPAFPHKKLELGVREQPTCWCRHCRWCRCGAE
jgi:hypothetical protein